MNVRLIKICLVSAMLFSLALILAHVGLLSYGIATDNLTFFWLPLLLMGSIGFYSVFAFETKFPLILIVIFALSLHLVQFVRQPANMTWGPDPIYHLQLVNHVTNTGHWIFGWGTDAAYGYSFYPLFDIFQSILCSVSGIPSMLCVKYSMALLNLLELGSVYFLLGLAFNMDIRTRNLIILLFSFSPLFNAFDSYATDESFAIILFPLILALVLGQGKPQSSARNVRAQVLLVLLLITVSLSHHFTSYMVAFSFLVPAVVLYLLGKDFVRNLFVYLLSLILPLSWLAFVASFLARAHSNDILIILARITNIQSLVGYSYTAVNASASYYPSEASLQVALLRTVLLVVLALVGLVFYSHLSNKKAYNHFRVLLIAYGLVTVLLLYFVDWRGITMQGIVLSDVRDRIVSFAFLPISFFSALGILALMEKAPKRPRNRMLRVSTKMLLGAVFVGVLTTATVFTAFPRYMYEATYSPTSSSELSVAAEQQYALGLFTLRFISNMPSGNTVFIGSYVASRYVLGYGLYSGTWNTALYTNIPNMSSYYNQLVFYVANIYEFSLFDYQGRKLNASTIQFLDNHFYKVYDNGIIYLYEHQRGPP